MDKAGELRRVVTLAAGSMLAAAFALAPAGAGAADEKPSTKPLRVRVTSAAVPSGRAVGTLVGVDDSSVTLSLSGKKEAVRLEKSAITQIEISRRRGNRGKAIGLGLLAGAVVGGAIGLAGEQDCAPQPSGGNDFTLFSSLCEDLNGTSTAAGVIVGAPVGALIGLALSHGERWESTSSDGLRLAIAPMKGGAAVRLSFRF
jgi:hypothetical protein